jgi:hypothetical protein
LSDVASGQVCLKFFNLVEISSLFSLLSLWRSCFPSWKASLDDERGWMAVCLFCHISSSICRDFLAYCLHLFCWYLCWIRWQWLLICIICTQVLQFISLCLWLEQRKKVNTDFSKLRKWTKGTNIFEKDYLFVPIHDKCAAGFLLFIGLIILVKQVFEHICTFHFKLHWKLDENMTYCRWYWVYALLPWIWSVLTSCPWVH